MMHIGFWAWLATIAGFIIIFSLSFYTHMRRPHTPSFKQAGGWTLFFVGLALTFSLGLWWFLGHAPAAEFIAGYITEYSLSIDNLFIFSLIMSRFALPSKHQQKALLIGIFIALVLRGLFIYIGGAALARYSWLFYLLGLFLIITAIKVALESNEDENYEPNAAVRFFQKTLRLSQHYNGSALTVIIDGRRFFTPMMMVMIAIGMTDILFALDSIPAIYGLTDSPYIVFTANAFALLGMVELYFLIDGLMKRLTYLNYGLAIILAFIGVKLIIEALHGNHLSFVNQGQPITLIPEIGTLASLITIVLILTLTALISLIKTHR